VHKKASLCIRNTFLYLYESCQYVYKLMQQSVVGKEMLVNHKWNDEMVKWNNGNEYVVNIGPPHPPTPTEVVAYPYATWHRL